MGLSGLVLLGSGLFAGYLLLRGLLAAEAPSLGEQVAVVFLLVAGAAALAAWITRRHYRQGILRLSEHVAGRTAVPPPGGPDWQPLLDRLEALTASVPGPSTEFDLGSTEPASPPPPAPSVPEPGRAHPAIKKGEAAPKPGRPHLVACLSPDLHWQSASPALLQLLGVPLEELKGRSILDAIPGEDSLPLLGTFKEALEVGEAHNVVLRLAVRKGRPRHLQMTLLTHYAADGAPLHLRCHFLDITDRLRTERELRRQAGLFLRAKNQLRRLSDDLDRLKESYAELYHDAPAMYFSLDAHGDLAAVNDTMLRALGYAREELLNQPYLRLLTPEGQQRYQQNPDVYRQAGVTEVRWLRKDGSTVDVWVRTTPAFDSEGQIVRCRSAALDVTERNRLAEALRASAPLTPHTNGGYDKGRESAEPNVHPAHGPVQPPHGPAADVAPAPGL